MFDRDEKRLLAQTITNILYQRPRYDFEAPYFVKIYRSECICLRLHAQLIRSMLDKQVKVEPKEGGYMYLSQDYPGIYLD